MNSKIELEQRYCAQNYLPLPVVLVRGEGTDFCPMGTPDGKVLFFSRRVGASWEETTAGDVYWVDAAVLDELRR